MMVECHIWNITFIWKLSVLFIFVLYADSYNLKCPSQSSWKLRAKEKCIRPLEYFCLYNNVFGKYIEGCNGPDWDRKGKKRIYAGNFSRGQCIQQRFQPFIFWTNGSMSDCSYSKSICNEEGQIVYSDNSTKDDRRCRCDNTKNYSFIKTPKNVCFCIPTEEDCSCYVKSCSTNLTLSADYRCTQSSLQEKPKCTDKTEYDTTFETNTGVLTGNLLGKITPEPKWSNSAGATTLVIFILVLGGFLIVSIFPKWTNESLQRLKRYCMRHYTDNCIATKELEDIEVEAHQQFEHSELTTEEVNNLRIIHLLFRVTCPVVRMVFNHKIPPNQLRTTLDTNKVLMKRKYRKKERKINDHQWNLLFRPVKGGSVTTVTSDDFDVRLMIYLLRTLAKIEIGDLYPPTSNKSVGAMLFIIKYIRNEVTQIFDGKLSDVLSIRYWDDIAQAVLKLMSSYTFDFGNDQEKTRLIERLFAMNPININTKTLCTFIKISERQPAMILNKLISEYCSFKNITIEKLLKQEQHQLYHKRIDTKSCCRCPPKFATYDKFITDKQWNALYELTTVDTSHICRSKQMECNERFVPKSKQTYNLSVAKALILNIPDILTYMKDFLCVSGFDKFLMQNQHELFHSMIEERCCKCCNMYRVHTEKPLIEVTEWNKLFMKKDNVLCKSDSTECCCQYALRNNVRYKHIDEKLVYKIFYVSGPIGVLNKIEGDALLCFVSWTVDDQPLKRTLQELLNMIKDKTFCNDISRSTLSPDLNRSDENEALKWMSMHLPPQNEVLENVEPSLQIFVHDRDGLNVKSIHIPEDFSMPRRTRKFTDITTEENNFLVVVHGLSTIVYPVIKIQFDKHCPEEVFKKIRTKIYEEKTAEYNKDSHKDANKCRKKRIYLTHNKKQQLFSDNKDEPKNLDLKLMIYILKRGIQEEGKTEGKKSNIDQLNVIDNIRREIVQSSSGVLKDSRFKDIMYSIRKAILHFEEEVYEKELLELLQIRNILD